jgi:hypothetical protein
LDADGSGEGREGAYEVEGVGAVGGGVVPGFEGDVGGGVVAGDGEGFPGEGAGFAGHGVASSLLTACRFEEDAAVGDEDVEVVSLTGREAALFVSDG